ncbi:MAG: hypothetical protein LQ337_007309 [Flavoplaca oasis]|nr:MAG: hypothetical protein LQ337_007309 [Flavoplaca oasis]
MDKASAPANENDNVFEDLSVIIQYFQAPLLWNDAQRKKFVNDRSSVIIDPVLYKLVHPEKHPGFTDDRNCLVFWARPPSDLRSLVANIQQQLLTVAPSLWLMPTECLHMTALEVDFSRTAEEIDEIVERMSDKIPGITDYPFSHRARLIKPMLSYDTAAIALSFVPAAGESLPHGRQQPADTYTYHHLRRDLYELSKSTGLEIASRYVVPSAHLTIARFVTQADIAVSENDETLDPPKVQKLLDQIEKINADLRDRYWPKDDERIMAGGDWIVGQEKGLDCRKGTLWYGGGQTIRLGKGF